VKYTTRMKLYTALLMVLLVILSALLLTRKDIDATIMRTPGMLFQERGTDSVSNLYNIKVVNKTMKDVPMNVGIERGDGKIEIIGGGPIIVKKEGQGSGSFFIVLPKKSITARKTVLGIVLLEGEKVLDHKKTNFLGPINQ
jgi:IG-like fold at C-terminal of FixG, putative oxidoreductase